MTPTKFKNVVWNHYHTHGRDMPWRITEHRSAKTVTPYCILVSELMLQQTQVPRVIPKYKEFISRFPTFKALANAPTKDVLTHWKGLGYNRRAINLKHAAETVTTEHGGRLPRDEKMLTTLPGIGVYTARAVQAFAFNLPSVIIETNIRTVYTHHFFPSEAEDIDDNEVLPLIEKTLEAKNPREWYYALMDYGAHLKQSGVKLNTKSKHYTKQSPFKGSNREARSKILSYIMQNNAVSVSAVARATKYPREVVEKNCHAMANEGLLEKDGRTYSVHTDQK
ncbi:MAG: A/G-specific adenine glycosylase [Candidatus Paceibacterota bacterium]